MIYAVATFIPRKCDAIVAHFLMALRLSTFSMGSLPIVIYSLNHPDHDDHFDDDDYFDDIDYHFGDVGDDDHSDGGFC